jgi:chromosome segregation ATPase
LNAAQQQNLVLSKQAGEAQSELRKFDSVKEELKEVKAANADLEAQKNRLAAENASLSAGIAEADKVLQTAKDLKSLLAKV